MVSRILPNSPQTGNHMVSCFLEGPVNFATVPRIRNQLLSCARKKDTNEISVEMAEVTQLDTAGVAMLVELWRILAKRGGTLRLSGLNENAKRLLHLAGVDQMWAIEDDAE